MNHKRGFTLIEMVISVFMITVAVVGIVQLTTKYIQNTKYEKESYIAALLAQEGVEIIKNIRDANWVESDASGWKNGLTTCSSGCEIDISYNHLSPTFTPWSDPGTNLYIDYNESQSRYEHYKYLASPGANDIKTIYRRKITIVESGADKLEITVDVYWRTNQLTVKEDIYNWMQ